MKRLFVLALTVALWAHPAASQPTPDSMLRRMDSDGDGKISHGEFRGRRRPFKSFDTDGDGFITRPEIEAVFGGGPAPAGPMLKDQVGMDDLDAETLCGIGRSRGKATGPVEKLERVACFFRDHAARSDHKGVRGGERDRPFVANRAKRVLLESTWG